MTSKLSDRLVPVGRIFFAAAMVAFGALFFVFSATVEKLAPAWPARIPAQPGALAAGTLLVLAGVTIAGRLRGRTVALVLGAIILLWDVFCDVDLIKIAATSLDIAKALALGGGAFVIAGTLPRDRWLAGSWPARVSASLEKLIPLGRFFLAPQMIIAGMEHFIYLPYVVDFVPAWIPGHRFWACFTGAALIAGGCGLLLRSTARLAAALLGLAIFTWVLVLHLPRAFQYQDANEWTSVFQALAMSGIAFVLARHPFGPAGVARETQGARGITAPG